MENPFNLIGKTVLITGASSGIGRATAIQCSKIGATVVISGRDKNRLGETFLALTGDNHQQFLSDLTSESDRQKLVEDVPILDGIVHSAGISGHQVFSYINKAKTSEMFDINFFAPTFLTKDLIKNRKLRKPSSIVFLTSTSGIISSYVG